MIARACNVPSDALLSAYVAREGTYTDCFEVLLPGEVGLQDFIEAFYSTWLFRLERAVLAIALRRRSRDSELRALAAGKLDAFAAWTVERRQARQILLCDMTGGTRSYLAVAGEEGGVTRLLFGSAVVGREGRALPWWVKATTPLHRLYAKSLLRLAERKLRWPSPRPKGRGFVQRPQPETRISTMPDYDDQNIFAKILRGEIPCIKVFEDDDTLCFMDIFPRSQGHCLVIPKTPCRNMLDATPEQLAACMKTVNIVANAAKIAFEADGVTLLQFSEAAGGQEVFHLHFHIHPRHTGVSMLPPGQQGNMDKIKQNADAIIAALS